MQKIKITVNDHSSFQAWKWIAIKGSINKPIQFVDQVKLGDRILLFYEEPEYARMLTFHYIRNGLVNGERCIYLVVENQNDHHQNDDYYTDDNNMYYSSQKPENKNNNEDNQTLEFIKRDMDDSQIDVSRFISAGLLYIGIGAKQLDYYEKPRSKRNSRELFESILPNSFYNAAWSSSS